MNKVQKLKTYFENKEVVRHINNYLSDDELKAQIIKAFVENGHKEEDILKHLEENENTFSIGCNVFFKQKYPKITISNLIIKSNKVIFDKCEILLNAIKEVNEKEFKTDFATYYIGGF